MASNDLFSFHHQRYNTHVPCCIWNPFDDILTTITRRWAIGSEIQLNNAHVMGR